MPPKKTIKKQKEMSPVRQQEIFVLLDRIEKMFDKITVALKTVDNDTRRVLKKDEIKNILENIHNIKY
ncbi:MAG: hypothetical protein COY69_03585 [Candidatus Magasanikbacteria bacterium CG_4_10_14_0_8_um_filter_32_14]|uniref:Uncharacterized protein n=2 Tax=Candidatus Magasanikiibacteriota TaxID=1752731 RepID=A0A2M7R8J1_9BACT|nr:MAG: hypothetical protein AUJ23_01365 [Candidatus Magasanikbacteria bacterium CG1_02_32_51]PIY93078.1 MAG: hypothetical protein COY69_03585 [Candidatus Magasanikbacteria bacterium CG_4_10_14_0_8_um_filter_32_14]